MAGFKKLNDLPIEIEYVEDEHEEENDFKPSFWFNNRRYFLENFTRVRNNPWISEMNVPSFIDAYESDNYISPLYIGLIDDVAVNVYREEERP